MKKSVILDYVRTPFAKAVAPDSPKKKEPGKLAGVHPAEMFGTLQVKLIERTGIDPKDIETVILGCVGQEGPQALNIGRQSILASEQDGIPNTISGFSVDHFCGSSATTIGIASGFIAAGYGDLFIAGGVQSMSRVPMSGWNSILSEKVYNGNVDNFMDMGRTAENLVEIYGISREEQDEFSVDSHRKMADAVEKGFYSDEIVPIAGLEKDDNVRPNSTVDKIKGLPPAFKKGGTVTAASSSPITDGAAAVLMASEDFAKANNLPVLANILSYASSGRDPATMGLGPIESSQKALERAGLTLDDIDYIELNEAFAGQALAVVKEWEKQGFDVKDKLNVDGGAIALGHPLAATGARVTGHAGKILQREKKRYALATMCIGGGQGAAVVIENPNYKASGGPRVTPPTMG